jgi:protein disulfide-isomerase A1
MAHTLISIAVLALAAVAAVAEDVLTLTADNFSEAVKKHDKLIVEFYAPWCGHCKKLEPEWEAAAGKLKDEGITLAKVDAADDANKPLAEKFEVQGFPTIKIFRGHKETAEEYEGPRETAGIVTFLKKQFGPACSEITTAAEATKATTPSEEISIVGVFPTGTSPDAVDAFKAAAESLRNEATFVFTTDAKLVKDAGGKQALVLYRDFDDKIVKFDGKFDKVCSACGCPCGHKCHGRSARLVA